MFKKIICVLLCALLLMTVCAAAESAPIPLFDQVAAEQEETAAEAQASGSGGILLGEDLITSMRGGVYCVPGSDIERAAVKEIRFINNTDEPAEDAWDASAAGDGSVLAWMAGDTLVIGANGGVKAPASCSYLFALYRNLENIRFDGNFDTSGVTDMTGMFAGCEKLREIDLNSLDVSGVTSMESMFEGDAALTAVHAGDWDLSSLQNSVNIFNGCDKLGYDTVDGLMTEKFEAMEEAAAEKYPPLKVGDRSDAVAELQKALMAQGYNSITKADGIFGARTARAVHAFKADHQIFDGKKHSEDACVASGLMQEALFSIEVSEEGTEAESGEAPDEAPEEPAAETGITLTVLSDGTIKSKELKNNQLRLNFTLKNTSSEHTVVGYALSVRATDAWGNELYDEPMVFEAEQTIDPEKEMLSCDLTVDDRGKLANLMIGVASVTYDDGTVITPESIEYTSFPAVNWL